MSDSSFPARWPDTDPDAITGHNVTPEGAFMPEPARICSIPAAGGLWATAADLVRFGLRWSSLLPEALARKALRPQAAGGPGRGQRGLGWLIDHPSGVIGAAGGALGASTSLLIRVSDNQTHIALTNQRIPIEPVNGRVLRACSSSGGAAP
jgi:CubicO group peptidase (beta-lactamase class C family)